MCIHVDIKPKSIHFDTYMIQTDAHLTIAGANQFYCCASLESFNCAQTLLLFFLRPTIMEFKNHHCQGY